MRGKLLFARRLEYLGNRLLRQPPLERLLCLIEIDGERLLNVAANGTGWIGSAVVQGKKLPLFYGLVDLQQGDLRRVARKLPPAANARLRCDQSGLPQPPQHAPDEHRMGVDAPGDLL